MVNQKKSMCQQRLEARASMQQLSAAASSLAAQMHSRIARATEVRVSKQRARETSARERVLHAQQVAREQHAKRRDQRARVFLASHRKVEVAHERRRAQLEETQHVCKTRVALVREKVQSVKDVQKRRSEHTLSLLQQQLREAERRREEQTQRMVRRLSARWQSVESVKDRVARAKFIQRWYRRHVDARKTAGSLRAVAGHVARVVQCWQQIAVKNFEQSMRLLQDRELARAAQSVLRVLLPSATSQSPGKRGDSGDKSSSPQGGGASFRVLLMAGMLAFHPGEIMESGRCDRLAFAARAMHKDMLRIYVLLASGTARELKTCVARLEAHFAFYFESFSRWKNLDAERLAAEMLRSYHDIFVMKQRYLSKQTAHEGDGVHQLVFQTEKQLSQLRSALAQVLGRDEALTRVEAVERNAEQQDEQMDSEDSEKSASEDDDERYASPVSAAQDAHAAGAEVVPDHQPMPPMQLESFLSDEKLVHELIMNPEFKIPPQSNDNGDDAADASSLATRVRDTMLRAFWDQVVAANDMATLLARTEELRVQFATAVAMRPELVASVNFALESSALQALMQNPQTNLGEISERCVRVVHAILRAEAPARNDATHAFLRTFEANVAALQGADASGTSAVRVLVDFLAFALKKVEDIRVDLMNVHMGILGAYLQRHGVEYEQKKLHEKLSSGARFEMTQRWLATEFKAYWASLDLDEKDRMARYDSSAFSAFLRHSVLALVTKYIEGSSSVWPEAFAMDVDRIRGYRDTMDRISIISSLLVVVQEYIARRRVAAPRDFFRRVGQQLSSLLLSTGISGAHLVDQAVEEVRQLEVQRASNSTEYSEELRALSQSLHGAFGRANPVFNLFASRVTGSLLSGQFCEASEIQVHPSLAPFDAEVRELALAIKRLAKHNESVHASLYNAIVKELIAATSNI